MAKVSCKTCGEWIALTAQTCPKCGAPQMCCPKCGSRDIREISGMKKAASAWTFGLLASKTLSNSHECKNCGNKFRL